MLKAGSHEYSLAGPDCLWDTDMMSVVSKRAQRARKAGLASRVPTSKIFNFSGHERGKGVTCIRWSSRAKTGGLGRFLASAGMDGSVHIYDPFQECWPQEALTEAPGTLTSAYEMMHLPGSLGRLPVRSLLQPQNLGIRDVCWSTDTSSCASAMRILSGGFDRQIRLTDVEYGKSIATWDTESFVGCLKWIPRHLSDEGTTGDGVSFTAGMWTDGIVVYDTRAKRFVSSALWCYGILCAGNMF
jgi:WD40 repeat protein